jgi:hypothetical protein
MSPVIKISYAVSTRLLIMLHNFRAIQLQMLSQMRQLSTMAIILFLLGGFVPVAERGLRMQSKNYEWIL